jgi:zinc transport system substrate-binding protein
MRTRRRLRSSLVPALVLALTGGTVGAAAPHAAAAERIDVVAAFYPLAEAARQVGGRHVRVDDLTPAGVEPHDLELDTDDVDAVLDADLAIVLGGDFQPGVEDAAARRDGPTLAVLGHLRRGPRPDDPHVWLDPVRYRRIVGLVADALADSDPAHAAEYRRNAARYERQLSALHADFETGLADCASRTILTAHEAFGWLADRYDLVQHGVAGVDPDAEPDPDKLADLADLAEREGVTTVFTETLVSPRVARTLAREAGGLRTAVLDPLEGLSEERIDAGDDYVSVMRDDLGALREALACG